MDIYHTNLFSRVVKFQQFIPSIFSVVEKKVVPKLFMLSSLKQKTILQY